MNHMSFVQADLNSSLRETAMLADVTVRIWDGQESDQRVANDVTSNAGAVTDAVKVRKNLLAGADGKLRDCKSAFNAARHVHYALTLPYSVHDSGRVRGPRLLPNMLFDRWLSEMSEAKKRAMTAFEEFVADYPEAIKLAQANLGALATSAYPTEAELRASFSVDFDLLPLPAGADFRGLPAATLAKVADRCERRSQQMLDNALNSIWPMAADKLELLRARLSVPDPKLLRESLITNLRDMAPLLMAWNITGDVRVIELATRIERMTSNIHIKAVRTSENLRQHLVAEAGALLEDIKNWRK